VKRFVTDNYTRAHTILVENKQHLLDMADALPGSRDARCRAGEANRRRSDARRPRAAPAQHRRRARRVRQPRNGQPRRLFRRFHRGPLRRNELVSGKVEKWKKWKSKWKVGSPWRALFVSLKYFQLTFPLFNFSISLSL
jgi:hypothetical protein